MHDRFQNLRDQIDAPARAAFAIVPHDANELSILPKGIYVGTGGDVVLRAVDSDADVTYRNLANGSYIGVRVQFVRATGTTAQHLIAEA